VINFRYHVVSLTAVFLALAIGLIVGTAALNGPLSEELSHNVSQLSRQNGQYRDQVNQLESEVSQREQFATEVAPALLAGKLTGRRVVVLSMQQSASYVDDMVADLQLAGAKVTGEVEIEDSFMKPANNEALLELAATSLASIGNASINGLPANSDGVETSTALLAAVLLDHTPEVSSDTTKTILQAYQQYLSIKADVTGPAESVVVLAAPPYSDQDAATENRNTVTVIDQFDKAGAIVVGAPGNAGQGNVISAITGDASLSKSVSTVDDVDTPQGRIAATLALYEQLVFARTGHYGIASSASSLLPKLPPT
jgi:hypothetical protein